MSASSAKLHQSSHSLNCKHSYLHSTYHLQHFLISEKDVKGLPYKEMDEASERRSYFGYMPTYAPPHPRKLYFGQIVNKLYSFMNVHSRPPHNTPPLLFFKKLNAASHASEFLVFIFWAHILLMRMEHKLGLTCFKVKILRLSSLRAVCFGV